MPIPKQKLPSLEEAYSGTLFGSMLPKPDDKRIVMVDPSELIEIEDQPFHPYTEERLAELAEDIKENGQLNPCTVRLHDGQKIILAGRNRKRACELAGIKVACLFIECDDSTANLILVNSNLNQRQELLPSEKAYAYKLQKQCYEAKGQRKSTAAVAEQNSENVKMIQRYIKLTDLIKPLMDMVDTQRLPVTVGVELSYLKPDNMSTLSFYLYDTPDQKVSVQQAKDLREWDSSEHFTFSWLKDFFHGRIRKDITSPPVCKNQLQDSPNVIHTNSDEAGTQEQSEPQGNYQFEQPQMQQETRNLKKSRDKPIEIRISIADLQHIPCNFNFHEADPEDIKDFIIDSLMKFYSN